MTEQLQTWRTPEAVRSWLMAQPEGSVVGLVGRYADCTLSTCYKALSGLTVGLTGRTVAVMRDGHEEEFAPLAWESAFIKKHDWLPYSGTPVYRERALAILDAIQGVTA